MFITKNLHSGQIRPLKFSMTVPVLFIFIKKNNSSLYLVQNYRNINMITIKNKHLLLLISELVMELQGV